MRNKRIEFIYLTTRCLIGLSDARFEVFKLSLNHHSYSDADITVNENENANNVIVWKTTETKKGQTNTTREWISKFLTCLNFNYSMVASIEFLIQDQSPIRMKSTKTTMAATVMRKKSELGVSTGNMYVYICVYVSVSLGN